MTEEKTKELHVFARWLDVSIFNPRWYVLGGFVRNEKRVKLSRKLDTVYTIPPQKLQTAQTKFHDWWPIFH